MATTMPPSSSSTPAQTTFEDVKQIDASVLNVGYVDAGPRDAPAILLLHGWPYDIHSFQEVTLCWLRPATGWSFRTCAATGRRAFARTRPSGTVNRPHLPAMRLP